LIVTGHKILHDATKKVGVVIVLLTLLTISLILVIIIVLVLVEAAEKVLEHISNKLVTLIIID